MHFSKLSEFAWDKNINREFFGSLAKILLMFTDHTCGFAAFNVCDTAHT